MSNFFDDDFTAELRSYFLSSVIVEVEKFADLIDDKLWKRIANEVAEQARAWSIDAKTNEFLHLAVWFEGLAKRAGDFRSTNDLLNNLQALKAYVNDLLLEKVDSPELAFRYSITAKSTQEILFLHCKSGTQDFAIPVLNVVEISSSLPLYSLPDRKPGLMGVVPYRGEAVPVINLQDHGFLKLDSQNVFYVVCEHAGRKFTLQVTATENMLNLRSADLQNVEEHSVLKKAFVKQFFVKGNLSIMVLDLEKLVA